MVLNLLLRARRKKLFNFIGSAYKKAVVVDSICVCSARDKRALFVSLDKIRFVRKIIAPPSANENNNRSIRFRKNEDHRNIKRVVAVQTAKESIVFARKDLVFIG